VCKHRRTAPQFTLTQPRRQIGSAARLPASTDCRLTQGRHSNSHPKLKEAFKLSRLAAAALSAHNCNLQHHVATTQQTQQQTLHLAHSTWQMQSAAYSCGQGKTQRHNPTSQGSTAFPLRAGPTFEKADNALAAQARHVDTDNFSNAHNESALPVKLGPQHTAGCAHPRPAAASPAANAGFNNVTPPALRPGSSRLPALLSPGWPSGLEGTAATDG
jgi:hypothetical protein